MQEHCSPEAEISSVAEMTLHVREAAATAASPNWKDRVLAAARVLNLPFPRAKAFYYREPRRVTAEEMDHARAAIRNLREQRRQRRDAEHVAWLREQIERHRASGEELRGPHIVALEHVLRMAGDQAGAVVLRPEGEGTAE